MKRTSTLVELLEDKLGDALLGCVVEHGQVTAEIDPTKWLDSARILRDQRDFSFEQLIDLCGVDYAAFGQDEWKTENATDTGFGRGVTGEGPGRFSWGDRPDIDDTGRRFAVVVHLISIKHNRRLRIRCFAPEDALPTVTSLTDVWNCANWFEREAFDLYGIIFKGHPDLRRILTDYGFVGHPFRKDFPLVGNVEVRYDPEKGRVVYEPVSIEPRVTVPRVIREDSRYVGQGIPPEVLEQAKQEKKEKKKT